MITSIRSIRNTPLRRVARLFIAWQSVPPESVNLNLWQCGTYACLGGHASMMRPFKVEGLKLKQLTPTYVAPSFGNDVCSTALKKFFGSDSGWLFDTADRASGASGINHWRAADRRMRAYLSERGINPNALIERHA